MSKGKQSVLWGIGIVLLFGTLYYTGTAQPPGRDTVMDCGDQGGVVRNPVNMVLSGIPDDSDLIITAVGLRRFEPVLILQTSAGQGRCAGVADDLDYAVSLPTVGRIESSNVASVQVRSASLNNYIGISVGSGGNRRGEFLLIVEGLDRQGAGGGLLSLVPSPALTQAGVDPTVYMLATSKTLNPAVALYPGRLLQPSEWLDPDIACDDAGVRDACRRGTESLEDAYITIQDASGYSIEGGALDAMYQVRLRQLGNGERINLLFASTEPTEGSYAAILHAGVRPD